jgi:hypothetical protein
MISDPYWGSAVRGHPKGPPIIQQSHHFLPSLVI